MRDANEGTGARYLRKMVRAGLACHWGRAQIAADHVDAMLSCASDAEHFVAMFDGPGLRWAAAYHEAVNDAQRAVRDISWYGAASSGDYYAAFRSAVDRLREMDPMVESN